jgi:hypothetical protein
LTLFAVAPLNDPVAVAPDHVRDGPASERASGEAVMHKLAGLVVLLSVGVVLAQDKDKAKDKSAKLTVVKVDVKGMTLTLKAGDKGKEAVYKATTDTKFVGPRGGKRSIDDDVLKPGATVEVVADGSTLLEVRLPVRASDKDKEKDKKEK